MTGPSDLGVNHVDPCGERAHASCLRPLILPVTVAGVLRLTGMPDSAAHLAGLLSATAAAGVTHLLILAEDDEIREHAPVYGEFLARGELPFSVTRFPIRDYGVPDEIASFRQTAAQVANRLRRGVRVVMHCRAGIGRTGLMAQAVLIELGVRPRLAAQRVAEAGSGCESPEQVVFLREAYPDAED